MGLASILDLIRVDAQNAYSLPFQCNYMGYYSSIKSGIPIGLEPSEVGLTVPSA